MGMTVVEKILARAAGQPGVTAGRRGRTARRPRHVARERGARDQPVPGDLPGHRPASQGLGPVKIALIFDHRVPAEVAEDRHQPEEGARVRRGARHSQVPRHPRRRGRHLPPDPARERLRPAGAGGGGHRHPHHQPRRARRLRLRHRRHRDGLGLGAGPRPERRGARRRIKVTWSATFQPHVRPRT